jgi:hypothetical protein
VGQRGKKIKALGGGNTNDTVFWMSLEEAKRAISVKPEYESMVERYERTPKKRIA